MDNPQETLFYRKTRKDPQRLYVKVLNTKKRDTLKNSQKKECKNETFKRMDSWL